MTSSTDKPVKHEDHTIDLSRRYLQIGLISVTGAIILVVTLFFVTSETQFGEKPRSFANIGGDFTLQTHLGEKSLSDFTGKVRVLYFGFTSCRAVCPNSLNTITEALNQLPSAQQAHALAIMVSIDPERDTPDKLKNYLSEFHANFIGMTGSQANIDAVTEQYAVYRNLLDADQLAIEHTSRYYIINSQDEVVDVMRHSTTVNELTSRLLTLL